MTRKALGAVVLAVGAALVLGGSALELYRLDRPHAPGSGGFAVTSWSVVFQSERTPSSGRSSPRWGYALVVAGVLVAFAAVAQFRSSRLAIAGRLAAALAVGLAGATTWSAYTTVTTLFGGGREPSPRFHWVIGPGLWTLAAACLVLLVGTVLVQDWPARTSSPPEHPPEDPPRQSR
ncbi:hypothetical protein [Actinosynnema sp. NPDC023587]|uniref:hypothetical protein n=1 Tax=Actinosynnema sp. NPDC023587 TaxID=3154695 RepID=UPI003401EA97